MIRTFEAFSGYKSQTMAFKKYGVEVESVGTSEIDEPAILTAAAIHCDMSIEIDFPPIDRILERFIERNISFNFKTGINPWVKIRKSKNPPVARIRDLFKACILTKNYGDISRIDPNQIGDFDLGTYSFPCQDISMAGNQKGLEEGSETRSSLLWEFQKIIEIKRPKYLMMENVKNLVGKKHKPDFDRWLKVLEGLGYNNYWKVINAKFCGIPQHRERVFCVSILKEHDNFGFSFYDDFDSGIRLKDVLENVVDEKYYLSGEKTKSLIDSLVINNKKNVEVNDCIDTKQAGIKIKNNESYCIISTCYKEPLNVVVETNNLTMGEMLETKGNEAIRRVYEPKGLRPALTTMQGGNRQPKIIESCAIRGRNPVNPKSRESGLETVQMLEVSKNPDINNCLTTVQKDTMLLEKPSFRIRKLTPKECFRLMGVSETDIDKINVSNSQKYKMAGNSIVVDCMKFLEQLK